MSKLLMCQHKVEELPDGKKKFTCNNCGTSYISSARAIYEVCSIPFREPCDHYGKFMLMEQCPTCGGTKPLPVHWCNKLRKLCAPTSRLPYANCLTCLAWEPKNV